MSLPQFRGSGIIPGRPWRRSERELLPWPGPGGGAPPRGHPAAYEAAQEVVEAVNTALILERPLLVTGRPGSGKTELAERIAYEFDLGPVLRFESQSLSEADDLFYRFDHVHQMVMAKLVELGRAAPEAAESARFVTFGALGLAIVRAEPQRYADLPTAGLDASTSARRSVVLIDEIDKASRDFPNDLLGRIEDMRFELRELGNLQVEGAPRDSGRQPIVVITSNSERDLPAPFLRRCVYLHIPEPDSRQLTAIVRRRVFGDDGLPALPPLYAQLLEAFVELRDGGELRYQIGTAELLDIGIAAQRLSFDANDAGPAALVRLQSTLGALSKHPADRSTIIAHLAKRLAGASPG